ncbi:hypothetical protein crov428 [Cafeteria roenbergensis virus]|uniref:Uncharacterized protein n=1 Tax=Cafeteria roenbergensis virus (strain BV-PW1) TaxID=693272 RepID=E3T5J9_CROVB|nr:hypothetical protein crov428 [Cafeteria roenbergensis virus BV-PW1]ADO67462.1 hypothetical protein crov428 [Cafeteria roenbergensis virus BV-PW1]
MNTLITGDDKKFYFTDEQIKKFPKYKENMIISLTCDKLIPFYNHITIGTDISDDDKLITEECINIIEKSLGYNI